MKYAVEQQYFDSGKISVRIREISDETEDFQEETDQYDYYRDVFASRGDAEVFRDEVLGV